MSAPAVVMMCPEAGCGHRVAALRPCAAQLALLDHLVYSHPEVLRADA